MRKVGVVAAGAAVALAAAAAAVVVLGSDDSQEARTCDGLDHDQLATPEEVTASVADQAAEAGRQPELAAARTGPPDPAAPDGREAMQVGETEHPFVSDEPLDRRERLAQFFRLVAPDRYAGVRTDEGTVLLLNDASPRDLHLACSLLSNPERLRVSDAAYTVDEAERLEGAVHEWLSERHEELGVEYWKSVIDLGVTDTPGIAAPLGSLVRVKVFYDPAVAGEPEEMLDALADSIGTDVSFGEESGKQPVHVELLAEEDLPEIRLY